MCVCVCVFEGLCVMCEGKVWFFSKIEWSRELNFDLKIGSLGNWVTSFGFEFRFLRKAGIISRNVFMQLRKT